jgi:hypothetical protein
MTFPLFQDMVLAADLPAEGLRRGDIVKPVDHHVAPDGSAACSVEYFNALGETAGVACVPVGLLTPLKATSVLAARDRTVPA